MRVFFASLTFTLLCLAASCFAQEQPIWIFAGAPDGANPSSAVVVDGKSGNLYGVTLNGGANELGAVFQLTPPATSGGAWTENVIYSFHATGDGQTPVALVENQQTGDLYGTTLYGGTNDVGVVFKLAKAAGGASWSETILFNLTYGRQATGNRSRLPRSLILRCGPKAQFKHSTEN